MFPRIVLLFVLSLTAQITNGQRKYIFEQPKMGSPFTITLYSNDSATAAEAASAAFRKADTLNTILSDYIDSSEINRLSAASGQHRYIPVSPPLFEILHRALVAAQLSNGSYDITVGPVVKLWRRARKLEIFPARDSIKSALQVVGYRYMHLDTIHHSVMLDKPGMKLDVGGLGKGFVARAALDLLQQYGFPSAMVNAGGKIVTGQPPPGKEGWLIGINAPGEKETIMPRLLMLNNMAVATSGDIYQYIEFKGKRYSHIVNPKTGIGITRRRNVTAIAADGTTADWLATACSILSFRKSLKLIKQFPGAALYVTEQRRKKIYQRRSRNFESYFIK
jgi:thiamine biosynthesis lipoprotein